MKRALYLRASRVALCAASVWAWPLLAAAQTSGSAAAQPETSTQTSQVEDVIVTSSRRETTLQRTPDAVSVLGGEDQASKGQTRLEDLQTSVPNVNFAATSNTSALYVRGVGNTFLSAGGDPGVALYQDGAYVSDQTTTNVNFFDVQRIEILRGPQGALYGRNAVGGAVSIISAKPTADFRAGVTGLVGNYGRLESEGFVSGPLGFADTDARFSFQTKHNDGYTRNELAGQPGAPDRLDDQDTQSFRLQTLTRLPSEGTLGVSLTYFTESDVGSALAVIPVAGVVYPVELLYGAVPSSNPRSVRANVGSNDVEVTNLNINLEQPIGANTLTVTANYRSSEQEFIADCDGTAVNNCRYERPTSSDDAYFDVHLASPGDNRLRWLIGATYLNFEQYQLNHVNFPFPLSYLDPTAPSNVPFDFEVYSGGSLKTESYAVYADLRWQLDEVWALTGQARYSETTKDALEILRIAAFGVNADNVPAGLKNTFTPFKIGVEAQFTPTVLAYANYATANKDGAINLGALQPTPIEPEEVKNFEIGVKSSFFDRSLQINAAAFHTTYENLQISQLAGTVTALANVPEATIDGAEIEIVSTPVDGLRLNLNAGYLDATLDEFVNSRIIPGLAAGPVEDLSGKELPYAAPLVLSAGAEYEFSPTSGYYATIRAEYAYHGRTYFNEFNDADNSQPGVTVANASASFSPDSGRWKVFGYINNITDETIQTGATIYSGLIGGAKAVSYAPPRTFALGLTVAF